MTSKQPSLCGSVHLPQDPVAAADLAWLVTSHAGSTCWVCAVFLASCWGIAVPVVPAALRADQRCFWVHLYGSGLPLHGETVPLAFMPSY